MGQMAGWNEKLRPIAKIKRISETPFFKSREEAEEYFVIGSFSFVKKAKEEGAFAYDFTKYNWLDYYSDFSPHLLNQDFIVLPGREIYRQMYLILRTFGVDCEIFVRPNAAEKTFTGTTLDVEGFKKFSEDFPSDLVVISSPKKILGEWRFAIDNAANILAYSLYRYADNHVEVASIPKGMDDFVKSAAPKIEGHEPYILDVAQLYDMSFKIIEKNCLSTSELYAMDTEKLVSFIMQL